MLPSAAMMAHCRFSLFLRVLSYAPERAKNQSVAFVLINVPCHGRRRQPSQRALLARATFSIRLDRHSAARTTHYYAKRPRSAHNAREGGGGRMERRESLVLCVCVYRGESEKGDGALLIFNLLCAGVEGDFSDFHFPAVY